MEVVDIWKCDIVVWVGDDLVGFLDVLIGVFGWEGGGGVCWFWVWVWLGGVFVEEVVFDGGFLVGGVGVGCEDFVLEGGVCC